MVSVLENTLIVDKSCIFVYLNRIYVIMQDNIPCNNFDLIKLKNLNFCLLMVENICAFIQRPLKPSIKEVIQSLGIISILSIPILWHPLVISNIPDSIVIYKVGIFIFCKKIANILNNKLNIIIKR